MRACQWLQWVVFEAASVTGCNLDMKRNLETPLCVHDLHFCLLLSKLKRRSPACDDVTTLARIVFITRGVCSDAFNHVATVLDVHLGCCVTC